MPLPRAVLILLLLTPAFFAGGCTRFSSAPAPGTTVDDPPPDDPASPARSSSFTSLGRAVVACPKDSTWCNENWPAPADGTMYRYQLRETRTVGGAVSTRTSLVYVPARVSGASPLVVFMHGGNGSSLEMMETAFPLMADQRAAGTGVSWRPNSATCRFKAGAPSGYEKVSDGSACLPPAATFFNSQGFILVLPDGLEDAGSSGSFPPRHWEDGRVPSPGFDTVEEQRDDVGFIDALIAAVRADESAKIDPQRIYVGGVSNGGMMTTRLICNSGDNGLPELKNVAAYAVVVASVPDALAKGLSDRESCPTAAKPHPVSIAVLIGTDLSQPDCAPFGCSSPTTLGDGRMPYGTPGSSHYINSPDGGLVIAAADTRRLLQNVLGGEAAAVTTSVALGAFTTSKTSTWSGSGAVLTVHETSGGRHELMSTRMDFAAVPRVLDFLFSFRRVSGAVQPAGGSTGLSGTF